MQKLNKQSQHLAPTVDTLYSRASLIYDYEFCLFYYLVRRRRRYKVEGKKKASDQRTYMPLTRSW